MVWSNRLKKTTAELQLKLITLHHKNTNKHAQFNKPADAAARSVS